MDKASEEALIERLPEQQRAAVRFIESQVDFLKLQVERLLAARALLMDLRPAAEPRLRHGEGARRVAEALQSGPKTVAELSRATGITSAVIYGLLKDEHSFAKVGDEPPYAWVLTTQS